MIGVFFLFLYLYSFSLFYDVDVFKFLNEPSKNISRNATGTTVLKYIDERNIMAKHEQFYTTNRRLEIPTTSCYAMFVGSI